MVQELAADRHDDQRPRSLQENLALYAELTIKEGINLQPGQELFLAADIGVAEFVRLVVEQAYKAGAKSVFIHWTDEATTLLRYEHATDGAITTVPQWFIDGQERAHKEGAARLSIVSGNPSLLKEVDPDRVAAYNKAYGIATKGTSKLISGFQINRCLIGAASPSWAALVFPDVPAEEALAKLWDGIFLSSRILEADPLRAWAAHSEKLEAKVEELNSMRLDSLLFRGPGTNLRVGLVESHVWAGGRDLAKNGVRCSPNIPTEEVFTMPHRARTDGVVRSTKPLSVRGQIVDNLEVEFKDGAVVRANASQGMETLQRLLDTDEGARRLGEVALVPDSAAVSRAGILFLNSLFDENAASHIALGWCYEETRRGLAELSNGEKLALGANSSVIHVDWMIGSGEMDVDGIRADGSATPLMRAGEWV